MAPHIVDDVHGAIALSGLGCRRGLCLMLSSLRLVLLLLLLLAESVKVLEDNLGSVDVGVAVLVGGLGGVRDFLGRREGSRCS